MTDYRVRIKPGCRHGVNHRYHPGDELIVSEAEKEAFGDKFIVLGRQEPELQADPEPELAEVSFDAKTASAAEVLEAVASGLITADDALEAEYGRSRGPRKTVLEALEEAG